MNNRKQIGIGISVLALLALILLASGTSVLQAAPPAQDTPALLTSTDAAGDWARIQQSGKLVVGTATGNPPFEYYTAGFTIDGFDAALMQQVAQQLGVTLELKDYTFEGLPAALQLGQIDAVAAALTKTDTRATVIDFSMPYYASSDAVLAASGSPLDGFSFDQGLSTIRLGVQRASIYEGWAQETLVKTGKLAAANLYSFARPGDMIQALKEGKIDLVMLDSLPAQEFIRQDGVKLVTEGASKQEYAVGLRKGSSLLPQLNFALTMLQQNGSMEQLRQEYLAPDEKNNPPAPTPAPVPVGCLDDSQYVADLTYDDSNGVPVLAPGQVFIKTWRVANSGTCPWNSRYGMYFLSGNVPAAQMGGQPAAVLGTVAPGATTDISVKLVAPMQPGQYQGFWQMLNAQGQPFGQKMWVRIQVPGGLLPTPQPTATPMQAVNFTVDRTSISAGACVNFKWDVTNVLAVYFYSDGQDYRQHGVSGQSGQRVCPPSTTTYRLRVEKKDGTTPTPAITIYVQSNPNAPYIQYFTADQRTIYQGQCVTLRWQVTGNADDVTIKRNGNTFWAGAPLTGERQDCLKDLGDYTYELEARGTGGKSKAAVTVGVIFTPVPEPLTPTPTPTPFAPAPVPAVIDYLTADPSQIDMGQCVNIGWSVGAGVIYAELRVNDSPWTRGAPFSGNQPFCPGEGTPMSLKFTLYAEGMAGTAPVSQDAYVQISGPAPEPTPAPTDEPLPTPVPEPPVIENFDANTNQIYLGDCVDLSWSIGGSADGAQLLRDEQNLGDVQLQDGRNDCPSDMGTASYRLHAYNNAGLTDDRTIYVDVQMMPGPIPDPDPDPGPGPDPDPAPDNGDGAGN